MAWCKISVNRSPSTVKGEPQMMTASARVSRAHIKGELRGQRMLANICRSNSSKIQERCAHI